MKLGLTALALCAASVLLGFFAFFVAAVTSGPTVAAWERAVEVLALFYIVLAVGAVVLFWRTSWGLSGLARGLATAGFAVVELFVLGVLFVL